MAKILKISSNEISIRSQSGFKERHRKRPVLDKIARMSDDEIILASKKNADKKAENSSAARVLKYGPSMFIAATSIAYGALTKGKMSDKVLGAAKVLAASAMIRGISKVADKTADKITKNDKKEHPFLKTVLGATMLIGGSVLALKGVKKGVDKISKVFKKPVSEIKKAASKNAEWLNNSPVGKFVDNISKKAETFAEKHPKLDSATKKYWAAPLVLGFAGMEVKAASDLANQTAQDTVNNVKKLVLVREIAREVTDKPSENN